MKALDDYFKLQQEIFDYFGYKEDWVTIPIDDRRDQYWILYENDRGGGDVIFYENEITPEVLKSGKYYENTVYTQRFLPKWIYRGEEYTMICCDTHTDGNKYLAIFDNSKEQEKMEKEESFWRTV